ncbi:MAG: hypothetical protein Q9196_004965 [Gyalolechia fulgens]
MASTPTVEDSSFRHRTLALFPVTAKQIHYLVQKEYIAVPDITEKEIFDKSKADQITKTIACLQTGWFVTECIARAIQKLAISPLELCTCAFILCTVAVYFFWLYKPLNVTTPTTLIADCSIATILLRAGTDAEKPFWNTPLDFVEPPSNYTFGNWPRLAKRWGETLRPHPERPQPPALRPAATHPVQLARFNLLHHRLRRMVLRLPSHAEKLIWRAACIATEGSLFVHAIAEAVSHHAPLHDYMYIDGYKLHWPANLAFFVPGATYFVARLALIAVAFSSLRSLPAESYVNLQ